ncbi:MAG: D-alanyl-D-alanine carboxypeptidase family protein, partial [Bacillota bacterium]|nr:D-alanyl-D-alanine carboxypeptidase family protein [Bacillota bacterium]
MNKNIIMIIVFTLVILSVGCSKSENVVSDIENGETTEENDIGEISNGVDDSSEDVDDSLEKGKLIELTDGEVLWLQESLKIAGYYTAMDGVYGSGTEGKLIEFQNSVDGLEANGEYSQGTKSELQKIRNEKLAPNLGDDLVFINKKYYLPSDFVPKDLREVDVRKTKSIELASHVAEKTEEMFADAEKDGLIMYLASGYRSYSYQEGIFSRRVTNKGLESTLKVVAMPGQSEHQTGLAIDITSEAMGYGLEQSFEQQPEFKWMIENCYKYGFILRYTKDKEDITKYVYEPWHYRYIGDVEFA